MKYLFKKTFVYFFLLSIFLAPFFSFAQASVNLDGPNLLPKSEIFLKPSTGSFRLGSTFNVSVYVNTLKYDVNAISIKIKFDPKKLSVVRPLGGKSIFGIWIDSPNYDNTKGEINFAGVIPNGIITESGLMTTITFKAIGEGNTNINISDYSRAHLNDGFGSDIKLSLSGGSYNITNIAKEIIKPVVKPTVDPVLVCPVPEFNDSCNKNNENSNQKVFLLKDLLKSKKNLVTFFTSDALLGIGKCFVYFILLFHLILIIFWLIKRRKKDKKLENKN